MKPQLVQRQVVSTGGLQKARFGISDRTKARVFRILRSALHRVSVLEGS